MAPQDPPPPTATAARRSARSTAGRAPERFSPGEVPVDDYDSDCQSDTDCVLTDCVSEDSSSQGDESSFIDDSSDDSDGDESSDDDESPDDDEYRFELTNPPYRINK